MKSHNSVKNWLNEKTLTMCTTRLGNKHFYKVSLNSMHSLCPERGYREFWDALNVLVSKCLLGHVHFKSAGCHLGTLEHFEKFKMAAKMAASQTVMPYYILHSALCQVIPIAFCTN